MFQRTRKTYSPGLIVVATIAALGLTYLIFHAQSQQPDSKQPADSELKTRFPADWFFAMREYPSFVTDLNTYNEVLQDAASAAQQRGNSIGFSAPWVTQGPANIGARINTVAVHPSQPNVLYVGYSTGGVWKSVNGGATWFPIFDKQNYMSIGDIAIDPSNPNTIYVGTGDLNISGYPFIGDGLWKSTNGGQTWTHLGLANTYIISEVIVHPTDPNKLYVAAMGQPFKRDEHRGLYMSTNGGQTWQKTLFVSTEAGIIDMEIDPSAPNTLYAAAWNRIRNNQESVVSGDDARVWKTTDGGLTWTKLTNGLPQDRFSRIGIALDRSNPNRLLATYVNTSLNYDGTYETTNGGASWETLTTNQFNPNILGGFGWYFGKIIINPFDSKNVWILGVTSEATYDGVNWREGAGWAADVHADHHDLVFTDANTAFLGTDGGLYKTTNKGGNWVKIDNIPTTQFYRTAYNPHNPDFYYGGAQDNGSLIGNKASIEKWERFFGGDGFQIQFHPTDPNILYTEWQNGNIVGSLNGGISFNNATFGIDDTDRRHWDMQYFISPNDPNHMYTGTYRVYKSATHPPVWQSVSPDLTDGVIYGNRFHTISTIAESALQPDLVYVGTTDGNVWRGNGTTQQWVNITSGLPERYVSSVKPSPTRADRVFVTHTGYKDGNPQPLVHRSDNLGATWISISGDLPAFALNDIIILPGHQDSVLFVATDVGVYGTLNGGKHWERLGVGLPFTPVYDLEFNMDRKQLVAGTFGRSILSFPLDSLRLGLDVSTFDPQANNQPLMKAYPTLFSNSLNVQLERLKSAAVTEVVIFSLTGQFVYRNLIERTSYTTLELPTADWAPGVYLISVRTEGQQWAYQKLIKL